MTAAELKHRKKVEEWTLRIRNCRSSGKSVKRWCLENGINSKTYYCWERKRLENLSGMSANGHGTELVRIEPQKLPSTALRNNPAMNTGITVRLGSTEIIFPAETDMTEIAGFVKLLGGIC